MHRQACQAIAWAVTIVCLIVIGGCNGSLSSTAESAPGVADTIQAPAKRDTSPLNSQITMNSNESDADPASMVATVFGVTTTESELAFDVLSSGCTRATDFQIVYGEPVGSDIPVTLLRTRQDPCRKMPELVNIRLPLATDKIAQRRVLVTNEISELQAIKRR